MRLSENIVWEITHRCNLRCPFCFIPKRKNRNELSLHDISKCLSNAKKLGVQQITFSGGEVFLKANFVDIMSIVRDYEYHCNIFTNGTLLDKKIIKFFILPSTKFIISLDGPKAIHEIIRGKNTWTKTINAIKLLSSMYVEFGIQLTLTPSNFNFLEWATDIAEKYGASWIQFCPVQKVNNFEKESEFIISEQRTKEIYVNILSLKRKIINGIDIYIENLATKDILIKEKERFVSPIYTIKPDGLIFPYIGLDGHQWQIGTLLEPAYIDFEKRNRFRKQLSQVYKNCLKMAETKGIVNFWDELYHAVDANGK